MRAVTFKWIRILFACWKQRTPTILNATSKPSKLAAQNTQTAAL